MTPLRIAMVGGATRPPQAADPAVRGRDVGHLRDALTDRGHEVHVFASTGQSTAELAAFGPDVVHAQSATGVPGTVPRGSRLVVTATRVGAADPLALVRCDRVIVRTSLEIPRLIRLGVPRRRIAAIPPGVDTELFRPAGDKPPRRDRPRILTVGQLSTQDGLVDLVLALRHVPEAELVIVTDPGSGPRDPDPLAARLIDLARRVRVVDRVRLLTGIAHEATPRLYRSADIVACAPHGDSLDTAALEAMACGIPVAGYAAGGLTDVVIDGVTGVLVPPGDCRALALALRRLLVDDMRRMSYGTAGVDRVRSRYEWRRLAADAERVYRDALADRPVPTD